MMRLYLTLTLLLTLSPVTLSQSCGGGGDDEKPQPPPAHTNIVLIGATGDLAKKYLWNGLFELFKKYYDAKERHFAIYACTRIEPSKGREQLSQILLNTVKCTEAECRNMKTKFIQATQYHQLKTPEHYADLGDKMNSNTQSMYGLQDTEFSSEDGRIVYLSIPPSAYTTTAKLVHEHLRQKYGRPFFRLVLEKPFGHDLKSARDLAESLAEDYREQEIYRVDHYLGKTVVKQILPFRQINKETYAPIWDNNHIERVEIVMKEMLDVKGRVEFYDEVGVIRDVMQNHLTEILALVAMETPQDSSQISQILRNKVNVLEQTYSSGISRTLIGQYATYVSEAINELDKPDYISQTPTFAATLLTVANARWSGVPFVMVAGKKLDEKASYVRVLFKDSKFCSGTKGCEERSGQIVFMIGSSDVHLPPMILVSKTLPKPKESSGWRLTNYKSDQLVFGVNASDMYALTPDTQNDAYTTLIESVYEGQRHLFTDTKSLIASWEIWTPVLLQLKGQDPRSYKGQGSDASWLDFDVLGTQRLSYVERDEFLDIPEKGESHMAGIPSKFREQDLVVKDYLAVVEELSQNILDSALSAVQMRRMFHVAFSGGRNTPSLLIYLSANFPNFPWQQTHIWMVDERCVDAENTRSNFRIISRNLLQTVSVIPHGNIHPMPVKLPSGLCSIHDNGATIYESEIEALSNGMLDAVVLGIGTDGHTASLFPDSETLHEYSKLVALTTAGPENKVTDRMTLTYKAINQARSVFVFATGIEKHDILEQISDAGDNPKKFPITGVKADHMVWYIDYEAWFGKR